MDQIKIGKFIAWKRKEQNLTQAQLAEKLGITDRAVSKWETGKSLPDASIMLEMCALLGITVNDLLCGEVVSMENYNEQMEKSLIEMIKQKERADKRLLTMEIVIGLTSTIFLFAMLAVGIIFMTLEKPIWAFILPVGIGFVQFIICMAFALRIEQVAGYYECRKCWHRYVPSYKAVNLAMHMGRTRYMKCPKCGKKSWQKKVTSDIKPEILSCSSK
jgi:transcriptional regulator with XRE-family HTH domain/DNA-directed RNA polymerase subunit RPC12/RpoP